MLVKFPIGSKLRVHELMNLLTIARTKNRVGDGRIFTSPRTTRRVYEKQRARKSEELGNPSLKRISFQKLRHWFGTMLYHEKGDIIYFQRMLGHKNVDNTLMYIHLEEAYLRDIPEEFDVRKVRTLEEALPLLEAGAHASFCRSYVESCAQFTASCILFCTSALGGKNQSVIPSILI